LPPFSSSAPEKNILSLRKGFVASILRFILSGPYKLAEPPVYGSTLAPQCLNCRDFILIFA
jgi:hypothetical protein